MRSPGDESRSYQASLSLCLCSIMHPRRTVKASIAAASSSSSQIVFSTQRVKASLRLAHPIQKQCDNCAGHHSQCALQSPDVCMCIRVRMYVYQGSYVLLSQHYLRWTIRKVGPGVAGEDGATLVPRRCFRCCLPRSGRRHVGFQDSWERESHVHARIPSVRPRASALQKASFFVW